MIRKILLILPILFFVMTSNAQIEVNFVGFVNTPDGTPIDFTTDVRVIAGDPVGGVLYDEIVPVIDGEFEGTFGVDDNTMQGLVFAQMEDCTGDSITTFGFWAAGADSTTAILNFVYCDSTGYSDCHTWISYSPLGSGGFELVAETFGIPPFTYAWDNGEVTESIVVQTEGQYCVTVTDSEGCTSQSCQFVQNPNSFCEGFIAIDEIDDDEATLTAYPFGGADSVFTYTWTGPNSFTSTDQTVEVEEEGTYCVEMVSSNDSCVINTCIDVVFFPFDTCLVQIFETYTPAGNVLIAETFGNDDDFTYAWSNGEVTESIFPTMDGEYCVTVTNDDGDCQAESCYLYIHDSIPDLCEGWIAVQFLSATEAELCAVAINPLDTAYTYEWTGPNNFTSTNSTVTVSEAGEYCVVMTSTNDSCVIEACYTLDFTPIDSCGVNIFPNGPWGGPGLIAYAWGVPPFNYLWSTGDTTAAINPTDDGEYCLTVTDALGCVSSSCIDYEVDTTYNDSCYVYISEGFPTGSNEYVLYASSDVFGASTYAWTGPNGFTSTEQQVIVSEEGEYCVTATNIFGCVSSDCIDFELPDTCYSYLTTEFVDPAAGGDMIITANAFGVAPFTYSWNTGENTESIVVSDAGEYCATITDADGCVSESCTFAFPIDSSGCNLLLLQFEQGDSTILFALPLTNGDDFDVVWNTGDTSLFIIADGPGEYCATLTSADCNETQCITVDQIMRRSIYGNVGGPFNPNTTDVSLFHEGLDDSFADIAHSNMYNNAFSGGYLYGFNDVEPGSYLVRAQPRVNIGVPLIPTYNGNVVFWDEATPLEVIDGQHNADITLIEGLNVQGSAGISGYVEEGLGGIALGGPRGVENPLPNASMILVNQFGQVVNHDPSDVAGEFGFSNLPYGTYEIHINIPGVEREMVEVTLTPNNPTVENIIFSVNGADVTTGIEDIVELAEVNVYPNPFVDQIEIQLEVKESAEAMMSITDINGKLILQKELQLVPGTFKDQIDLSNFSSGMYLLNIVHEREILSKKIIKE